MVLPRCVIVLSLCRDSGTRDLCRSLLLQLANSSPTGGPAVASTTAAAAAAAGWEAEKDWAVAAVEGGGPLMSF